MSSSGIYAVSKKKKEAKKAIQPKLSRRVYALNTVGKLFPIFV